MNNKLLNAVIGTFTVFCFSVGGFLLYKKNQNLSPERTAQSQKAKVKKIDNRTLELGTVIDSSTQVPNEPSALFNDPAIKQAWGLKKSDAARAWSITKGSKKVIVAVIDTGIDIHHEDLKNNLWQNPGESGKDAKGRSKAANGIDDDGNGYVDDVYGWNYVSNNAKLDDNHGHGTHIAGIIGAEAGNRKGISGISPEVSLMILKYYDPKVPNTDNLKNTIQSINYAVKMGAHIINYSGGGTEFSQEEHDAVAAAEKQGILFVAAAGNERSNSDEHHYYPADYKLKNIISVTAIDPTTEVLSSSNYGTETVDIAAPGQTILSCLPNNSYGLMTGTSQATAFVTGAAVLVIADKELYGKADDVKRFILATGDSSLSLANKTRTSRQLNLFKSLTILEKSTGFAGTKFLDIMDRSIFSSGNAAGSDPNVGNNRKQVDQMAAFGNDIVRALGQKPAKKAINKTPERLGTKPNDPDAN
ncbi:MAG: S8 family peptidase [Bdellovibrionota bacterium]